ncbi:hypothetical protein D3C76_1011850 [compost metagenome]
MVQQEGCIGQLRQFHLLPARQRVVCRQQHIHWFITEGLVTEGRIDRRQAATQFQFAIEHCLLDAQATAFDQLHVDIRIAPPVFGEQCGEQRIATQQRQPQAQFTARQMAQVIQLTDQFVVQAQHGFGTLQDDAAGSGEVQLRSQALQQCHAQALFQLCNLFTHGRLADVQRLACLGKATLAHDLDEAAKLFEFHF